MNWRTEVWHPLTVHFPIVLLMIGALSFYISLFLKSNREWQIASALLLFSGVIASWVSVWTGDLADGIVARKICDPTILKEHENAAITASWIFSFSVLLVASQWSRHVLFFRRYIRIISIPLIAIGLYFLLKAGHSGASLVYEQGAGVLGHPTDCQ